MSCWVARLTGPGPGVRCPKNSDSFSILFNVLSFVQSGLLVAHRVLLALLLAKLVTHVSDLLVRKFWEAVADKDDYYGLPLCTAMIPMDGVRLCPQHTRECTESWTIYKYASFRAELQPRVLNFSRRLKTGRFHVLREVEEAVDVTEEFLFWAKKELDERRNHGTRFYAYGAYISLATQSRLCRCPNHATQSARIPGTRSISRTSRSWL